MFAKLKKISSILIFKEKKSSVKLFLFILLAAFIDTLGVASILPFIYLLTNPQMIFDNKFLYGIYQLSTLTKVSNINEFLFFCGIIIILLLTLAAALRVTSQSLQIRFYTNLEYNIGKRIIDGHLHKPYSWFLDKNSIKILKNVFSETNIIIHQTIVPVLNLISHSTIVLFLFILLLLINFTVTIISIFCFSFAYILIFYSLRKLLKKISLESLKKNEERYLIASDIFSGIKEIKLAGSEQLFVKKFSETARSFAKNQYLALIVGLLPRHFIELIAFGGIVILILVTLEDKFLGLLPMITLFSFAGYRILPGLQQIYNAISQINFSNSNFNNLFDEFNSFKLNNLDDLKNNISFNESIILENINFNYPNSNNLVLKNINLVIPVFSKTGIIGSTGSGKTTCVDVILGLLQPQQGNLMIDGNIINLTNIHSWQRKIGYVPQQIYLQDTTIANNIAFGNHKENINKENLIQAAKIANLHEVIINKFPNQYDTIIGERGIKLSGGQRQRIGIARALYNKPEVLILDEGTNALDHETEKSIIEEIGNFENKMTIILVTHRLKSLKNCNIIYLLEEGKIKKQGTYDQLNLNDFD
jgi:ABC-type bacteriocin/lantibiotic exporter with double-glycine peptidase domain